MHYELNNFKTSPAEFIKAIKSLPADTTSVDLLWSGLSSAEVATALAALPPKLHSLNLTGNSLGLIANIGLIAIIKALPQGLKSLCLSTTGLGNKTGEELAAVLKELPPTLQHLILANNDLGDKKIAELIQLFKALPQTLKVLDLRCNDLLKKHRESEVGQALNAVPPQCEPPYIGDESDAELELDEAVLELDLSLDPVRQRSASPGFFDDSKTVIPTTDKTDEKSPKDSDILGNITIEFK